MSRAAKRETGFPPPPICVSDANGLVFSNAGLPKTRVGGPNLENQAFIEALSWLSSTSRWGCGYRYDGTASGRLVGLDYADQRFYASYYGRFNTPDRLRKSARRRNPESWNRYIYVNDDPINNIDPSGNTCVEIYGKWVDNGTGCSYAGTEVSDWGSVNQSVTGVPQVSSSVSYPPCTEPCGDVAINPTGAAIVQATGQLLNSISVGVVFFAPIAQTQVGPVHGEGLGVAQYDSNSGYSTAVLGEAAVSVGPVSGAVGLEQNTTTGSTDTLFFASVGDSSTGEVGAMVSYESGTFGFFAGIGGWGVGGYISLGGAGGTGGSSGGGPGIAKHAVDDSDE